MPTPKSAAEDLNDACINSALSLMPLNKTVVTAKIRIDIRDAKLKEIGPATEKIDIEVDETTGTETNISDSK